ncbi:hypothetical protein [Heyndrickxia coagulans]|uniref:hypothetical protein n=1 Tax=Heyndrickxia coagulans TaxID=1398 RepID=UPI002164C66C|nr:hypothetical protein [Heyndrickxia coagulans]
MPAEVVIENGKAMDNNASMAVIDNIAQRLEKIDGVEKVSSVTRPEGKKMEDFYIDKQMITVTDGLSQKQNGVDQINAGLKTAREKLGSADFSKVNDMVDGTAKLENGMGALATGLEKIQNGIGNGSDQPETLANGIATIEKNLSQMSSGISALSANYGKMQAGYAEMGKNYQQAAQALLGVKSTIAQMQTLVTALGQSTPSVQRDRNYLALSQMTDRLSSSLKQITPEGINTLNSNYNETTAGFKTQTPICPKWQAGFRKWQTGSRRPKPGLARRLMASAKL